jgi:hypothetical protein
MFNNKDDLNTILYTVTEILKADKLDELIELMSYSQISIEQTGYDNWNGGIYYYTLYLTLDIEIFVKIRDRVQNIETTILEKFNIATRHIENEQISSIMFVPKAQIKVDWSKISGITNKSKLIEDVNYLIKIMISVSTGGDRIQDVNDQYKATFNLVEKALQRLSFTNPNPYRDLWEWYTKWSSTFTQWKERREFIRQMYNTLLQSLEETSQPELISVTIDLSNWERIERSINELKIRQTEALTEEQYQVVGLLSRETIITLAQVVYNKDKHQFLDGSEISKTDAKRMLDAYITVELGGTTNETVRRYARATLDLANELTHKRTATKKHASLCAIATISIINLIGTIEGRI